MDDNTPVYQVDAEVPMPEGGSSLRSLVERLEVGESFSFPYAQRPTIQTYASLIKREASKLFTVKRLDETTGRIWRKE